MCLVGTGATFALTTGTTAIGRILSMGGWEEEIADIEDEDLATIGHKQYCPGKKIDHGELELQIEFDPNLMDDFPIGVLDIGTLTFPTPEGEVSGAKLAGTGYLKKGGFNGLENDERIEGVMTWRFNGKVTPPAYTDSVPV